MNESEPEPVHRGDQVSVELTGVVESVSTSEKSVLIKVDGNPGFYASVPMDSVEKYELYYYGAEARALALVAGDQDWMKVTRWPK